MKTFAETTVDSPKLVDAEGLLEALFDPACRPSIRWLRQMQAQRTIPYIKIGHLVRFDVDQVRAALHKTCTVNPRY
ncbi:MAG: hypothetical protein Q7P63_02975 [Verrucomicrobiota bacterium JB022]|nr:hypothetical protein [Verrucomicrobiota bacterium JB022]